jgi:hypothetical protein
MVGGDGGALVQVTDSGIGLPRDNLKRSFSRSGVPWYHPQPPGHGLLYICRPGRATGKGRI